jgi:hypothetical protein
MRVTVSHLVVPRGREKATIAGVRMQTKVDGHRIVRLIGEPVIRSSPAEPKSVRIDWEAEVE